MAARRAGGVRAALGLVAVMLAAGPAARAQGQSQRTFASPEEAVTALASAAKKGDTAELQAIFGAEAKEVLSSGDPVADQRQREVFVLAVEQGWKLEDRSAAAKELVIGHEEWPFPIPLVKEAGGWRFDTAAGKTEILARRIGRNELSAIRICATYVRAQNEYASQSRDGKASGCYAQKVRSDSGKQNGLYWPSTGPGEQRSPLGELAAEAASEGYTGEVKKQPTPFHGYHFRILTAQGKDAPGGGKSYVVSGDMTGGFAMVAYPAEYANSGIMSFIVSKDGVVYEKDLGEKTATIAGEMKEYNPDASWGKVDLK